MFVYKNNYVVIWKYFITKLCQSMQYNILLLPVVSSGWRGSVSLEKQQYCGVCNFQQLSFSFKP